MARLGRRRCGIRAHARRTEPLERGQGPFLGALADRTRVRSEVRPSAGGPLPARGDLPALAARQAAEGMPLRPARGHETLRARERVRGRSTEALSDTFFFDGCTRGGSSRAL